MSESFDFVTLQTVFHPELSLNFQISADVHVGLSERERRHAEYFVESLRFALEERFGEALYVRYYDVTEGSIFTKVVIAARRSKFVSFLAAVSLLGQTFYYVSAGMESLGNFVAEYPEVRHNIPKVMEDVRSVADIVARVMAERFHYQASPSIVEPSAETREALEPPPESRGLVGVHK